MKGTTLLTVNSEQVLAVVVDRVRAVMGLEGAGLPRGTSAPDWRGVRFDDDLHADSLDVVEIVEGVERELRRVGLAVSVADAELADLVTVGDAVDAFLARAGSA